MEDYDVIETSDDGKYRVVIMQDTDCERPMDSGDWWASSVLVHHWDIRPGYGWDGMYDPNDRLSAMQRFEESRHLDEIKADPSEAFKRYMRIFHGVEVFDVSIHNGYWDTSNALAWLEPSELKRLGFTADNYPDPKTFIDTEITEHNRWADGECYGYSVQKRATWSTEDPDFDDYSDWKDTGDSLWGLIGRDYAEHEAIEALAIASQR